MAITNGKVEGRITIPTGGVQALTCTDDSGGPTAVTIDAGDYYWSSPDSDSEDFAEQLAEDINAAMGQTWTVTIAAGELGTGKVTLGCTGSTCTVTWNVTAVRDLCGYTGNLSGATSYTSTEQAEALWIPDGPPISPYGLDDPGADEPDWTTTESPAGDVKTLVYQRKTVQEVTWGLISQAKCRIAAESTVNESWQKFTRDVLYSEHTYCSGTPIRIYPDADTDATYYTYRVSGNVPSPQRERADYVGLWRISLPRLVLVT